ncbi:MAG: formylmethanofuran dehydrogenase subunit E family protein [Armatimonadetes bacterium]|nr:formylmethanofuran dehydrogenase subunit E family protein [Armatimonadota bacterium]
MSAIPRELQDAARFHTHLGPYLVIGLRMGRAVTDRLGAEPFSYRIRAHTGRVPPYSCSVDGIQLSTPCTTGNGCVEVTDERLMALDAVKGDTVLRVALREEVFQGIENECSEDDQEAFALRLWSMPEDELFTVSMRSPGAASSNPPTGRPTGERDDEQ